MSTKGWTPPHRNLVCSLSTAGVVIFLETEQEVNQMYLKTMKDVETFKNTVDQCEGEVWLQSSTDYYNMKSALSQYVGLARLLDRENNLELFARVKADETKLIKMFADNPGIVA